jgi:hypothetical protein
MDSGSGPPRQRVRRWTAGCLTALLIGLWVYPHFLRLRTPSLYSDDIVRIAQVRTMPLSVMLVRPFNEHMAPLFELTTWVTWQLAGKRLVVAPVAFTVASILPSVLSLFCLVILVWHETGSRTTARVAAALFATSWLPIETAWWYSASSFMWALFWTLLAWLWAVRAHQESTNSRKALSWLASALAAIAAPASSAIGLLAGPVASLRVFTTVEESGRRWTERLWAVVPSLGTLTYLAIVSLFRYRDVLTDSLHRNANFRVGLLNVARATIDVLIPAVLGVTNIDRWVPTGLALGLFAILVVGVVIWSARSRLRGPILSGVALILGGYLLTYCVRAVDTPHDTLEIQRYHLFPHLGLVLVMAAALVGLLGRFDRKPLASVLVASMAALTLLVIHLPVLKMRSWIYQFPSQDRTLAAIERLEAICARDGISSKQALAALEPLKTRWFELDGLNGLMLVTVARPKHSLPNERVRDTILAALTPDEREAISGGMDATPYLQPVSAFAAAPLVAKARLVVVGGFEILAVGDAYQLNRVPGYLEYEITESDTVKSAAQVLALPTLNSAREMEIWWADGAGKGRWSETRSFRLRPPATTSGEAWAVPLDRLPHWSAERARRLRIQTRWAGSVSRDEPRLVR